MLGRERRQDNGILGMETGALMLGGRARAPVLRDGQRFANNAQGAGNENRYLQNDRYV